MRITKLNVQDKNRASKKYFMYMLFTLSLLLQVEFRKRCLQYAKTTLSFRRFYIALPYLSPFVSGQEHLILIKNKQLLFSIITFLMLSCDLNLCFVIIVFKLVVTYALMRVFYRTKSRSFTRRKASMWISSINLDSRR